MKRIGYKFKPMPARVPSAWRNLRHAQLGVMMRLWWLAEPDAETPGVCVIDIDGDPVRRLVRDLDIADRRDAKTVHNAVLALIDAGLIELADGVARLHQTPVCRTSSARSCPASVREDALPGRLPDENTALLSGKDELSARNHTNADPREREIRIEGRRTRERATPAPERCNESVTAVADSFSPRRPGHPMHASPPPEAYQQAASTPLCAAEEPSLAERIVRHHKRLYAAARAGAQPADSADYRRASESLASWAEGNAGAYQKTAPDLARTVLEAGFKSARLAPHQWPLRFIADSADRLAGPPPGSAPLPVIELKPLARQVTKESTYYNYIAAAE